MRNPPELDHSTRNDLLSFYSVGKDCFIEKVEELLDPSEKAAKPSRSKLKTFTKKNFITRQVKTREKNLSSILANAFKLLQSGLKVVQTCKYPLAISDVEGNMRPDN